MSALIRKFRSRVWPGRDVILTPPRMLLIRLIPSLGRLPDFVIIGAQRAGTSSLYQYLEQHPGMATFSKRELNYFGRHYRSDGVEWYQAQFPFRPFSRGKLVGEKTPEYLYHPHIPGRVKALIPKAKFIALLRNPVDRSYSQYIRDIRAGRATGSFEDLVDAEVETMPGIIQRMCDDPELELKAFYQGNLGRSLYADQLERWMKLFPREQFLILRSEDLFGDAAGVFQEVTDFLGLDRFQLPGYKVYNARHSEPMNPETRRRLVEYFRPHNQRLYQMLGRDMGWDQ